MINIRSILNELSGNRSVFHSEADFQHALAWEIHKQPCVNAVRLEKRIPINDAHGYLDLLVDTDHGHCAIELKYKTRGAVIADCAGEIFELKNQSAQDIGRHDFIKDIWRLERYVKLAQRSIGYAILLTNDQGYWQEGKQNSVDAAFRLSEGRVISGVCSWTKDAAPGTTKGRNIPIAIDGRYALSWNDYSNHDEKWGRFRHLIVEIR